MRKFLTTFLTLFIFFGGAVLYPVFGAEFVYESGESFVEYTEDIDDDLYISGDQNVLVEGNVTGDLFVAGGFVDVNGDVGGTLYSAGGNITINGNVAGNVIVSGGQVDIKGDVGRDVFAAAGTLNINGNIGEDAMIAGGQITIKGDVGDDVRAAGGILKLEGDVGDDLLAGVGQLDVRGNVGGDAYVTGDSVSFRSENIGGDLVFYGEENMLDINDETKIGGELKFEEPRFDKSEDLELEIPGLGLGLLGLSGFALFFKLVFTFVQALGLILLGWLVSKFAPVKLEETLAKMNGLRESARSFGLGFLALPAGIFLIIFLAITIIGWPVIAVLMALFSIATTLVVPVVGLCIGRWILEQFEMNNRIVFPLFIGVFLIQFIRLIPIFGALFYMVIFFVAIGAMLRMQYEKYQLAKGK